MYMQVDCKYLFIILQIMLQMFLISLFHTDIWSVFCNVPHQRHQEAEGQMATMSDYHGNMLLLHVAPNCSLQFIVLNQHSL